MRILVGCEESGKVRDAFIRYGHDAVSCDVLPTRKPGPHLQMDVFEAIYDYGPWDVIILFPDCTAMSLSGNRWYGRAMKWHDRRIAALQWTAELWQCAKRNAKIGCALENPTSVLWSVIGRPQYIQPHMFGHGEMKKTGILTHNLPDLTPTNHVSGRLQRIWKMGPSDMPNEKEEFERELHT